jgi:hypothetical protein
MTKQNSKKEELIEQLSNCMANEYVNQMKEIFAEICSDKRLLATVWASDLLDEGDQCWIARQAMELAIEISCAEGSSVYEELPEITDVWTWGYINE